ncbi:molybdenum cofactor biosynthesis protein MoaE [Nesterenkonia sp.]|uniref:molybdenum cofactor biosynthesis protein MoaE n=1 Tax=Nesterenkonia sp. TaxID=704201 RepID=UPI002620E907|nr:molybdenum cofactor biosynthesis protein MoaE [Nesterenkonia sp.]
MIVSTRAAAGTRADKSAPLIADAAERAGFTVREPVIVPDGEAVGDALRQLLEEDPPAVIITSGGTGVTADDRTPEFTEPLLDIRLPGITEALRSEGRSQTALAALSRGVAGVAGSTVVVNLPGSPTAVTQGMAVLAEMLPHLCDQLAGDRGHHTADIRQRSGASERTQESAALESAQRTASTEPDQESGTVVHTGICDRPLDPARAEQETATAHEGAVVVFCGVVRNHDQGRQVERLDYTAHPSAAAVLEQTAAEVAAAHPHVRLWAEHRIGQLTLGDHALVAAAASAHRAEAFAACAELVEQIKQRVPIWKEQFFTDGTREWVGL